MPSKYGDLMIVQRSLIQLVMKDSEEMEIGHLSNILIREILHGHYIFTGCNIGI